MAYSSDYRQMILTKLKEGASFRELAEEYQLSPTTIQRWKKNPERKKRVFKPLKIDNELLKADVKAYPDDYQWERAQRFGCSQKSISRALKRIGMTLKKRR
ncbi:IS630 transposase-related protein [Suttonella ornithocola]|uniref:Transposase and inactivated derivatives n=1 Tax=Suttonella ornithocola TaxID=279832 RepID=A0A380MW43_9GAMM|nr:IS630 transposase-related protein [Suttonella ornithocola]SUO95931.1 Transposase and inactivated derivatives [Suttonella ornithocola]